ncbi:hypothetical protein [Vibrio litoralis]|uniref:hypothetical protein n=1 Tax=Vibrio litoralis TaxID=335972 RepID=UPI0006891348|nr:hypothetical protein [Vibrio litoralis]
MELESVERKVIAAACKYGETIIVGVRHYDGVMHGQLKQMPQRGLELVESRGDVVQGFIDNKGNFLDRVEALALVKESGQPFYPNRNGGDGSELYSEGVW